MNRGCRIFKLRIDLKSLSLGCAKQHYSNKSTQLLDYYKVLVVGGGTGGCSVATKFVETYGSRPVGIIEPSETHYYQPMFTMIGGGLKTFDESHRRMADVLPQDGNWIKDKVVAFNPDIKTVTTENNDQISYDYLVVALGLQVNYNKVKGLEDALKSDPRVCSNYSPDYVKKTLPAIQSFKGGNALFTFPNTPIKCAGAPQKIMYLAQDYWRKVKLLDKTDISFNSSLGAIFAVKKYAESLTKIINDRNIKVNFKHNLVEVKHEKSEAIFENVDKPGEMHTCKYDFLHVTPPMSPPSVLVSSPVADAAGWLDVNKHTLQHQKYPNIFGLGDCTNVPTSKTAAAVAAQSGILYQNLKDFMVGETLTEKYNGYTSCPLVVGQSKCILAEFNFDLEPLETFPINQGKPSRLMFHLKKDFMPYLYWSYLLKGKWDGPNKLRKIMHLGF